MCDKRNAPAAARPVLEEALVALAGELASVAGGGSVAPAVEPPGGQSGSSSAQFIGLDGDTTTCSSKKRAGAPLGPESGNDLALDGSGKKQASVAAAALLAVASSGQTTGELMSEYKELQGKYDKLRKQCDKLEKKNTELLDFKKAVTPKLTNLTIRARREAAAFSPMDISTCDLDSSTGREAKRAASKRVRAGLMFACSTVKQDGTCTASPAKGRLILERLLVDEYWPLVLTAEQTAAEDLGAAPGVLPRCLRVKLEMHPARS